ncbi:hypothetical protein JOQ06_025210, partial [Pogonophryne albipinna]
MQFLLLLQVCLLGLGLSVASPGRRFLIGLPPHNGPTGNVSHQVTITASGVRTSVTVKVLESSFVQRIYLSAHQSKRIHLPLPAGMTSDRSSSLLSVKSIWPVTVITSLCTRAGCDHRLLHDVYSWGTQYYPITPNFPNQTSVSQMVITSSDRATGSSVVLDTAFDLALRYDWKQHLQVEVGPELYGALCVCTRSQTKFPDINGNSLRVGCSLLKRSGGPFADCHSLIDPEAFLRSCTNNLCLNESASSMCEILTDYANICQRISSRVRNWRTIAKCPIVCPLNSHFEICGSACPATCGNPEAHSNCTLPCVESCQCNRGYLLSGGKCVPHGKCGCLHPGTYYYPKENFWMGKHCQERCVCQSSSKRVVCSLSQCQDGEVCKVVNGVMGCHAEGPGLCIAKVDPHYTTFDGRNLDVYGNCTCLLTSLCLTWGDMEAFSVEIQIKDATNIVSFRHLKMVVSGYSIEMSNDPSNRVEVNGLLLRLPSVLSRGKVKLYMTGQTKFIETDFGVVVMYSSDILTIQMPRKFSGNLCGLCGNFNSNPEDDVVPDDDSDISQAVRHWKTSSDHECVDVPLNTSGCNSQDMALYEGKGFCARLLDKEGVFKSCHKMVDPESFYNNCVQDFCYSNQTSRCQILSCYVAVCQEMGAKVNEWRTSTFCGLSCPPNSEYSLCASQISDCVENPSPLAGKCKEGCFCKPGYFHSVCEEEESDLTVIIQREKLHLRVHGVNASLEMAQLGKIDGVLRSLPVLLDHMAILHSGLLSRIVVDTGVVVTYGAPDLIRIVIPASNWGEGCSEQCNCSSASDMYCEPASCPKGESCTLLNTWGCAKTDNNTNVCEDGETCVGEPLQTQCWVLGDAHFYTFDGKVFEFLGNCTYTLVHVLNDTSENTTFWVGVEKDRTPNEASSLKAIHVQVAEDNVTIYRGEKGHAWMNGDKKLIPVTLPFGHVKIYRSGMFVVVDTSLGIQVKYDCSHVATILLSNTMEVYGMCGNNNGIEEDDLRTPQGEPVDATTFGWSWRVPDQEAQCTADCGNACPRCSAEQLLDKNVATRWISMHEYIWSPQNLFYQCREVVNYTKISAAVSMFDLCSSNDTQKTICPVLEAYVAACQNAGIKIGEWRNVSFCPISCPRNSHYTSCGSSCPATSENPFRSRPCILACVETCQCDPGFVLVADSCVPLSQCGCTHNGSHYRSNQTFWADEGCTELFTFDQHNYDLNGSCQYQLLGMCAEKQGPSAIQIHAQTDGHLDSALHLLVNVSGVLVELNSKNTKSIEVDGVKRNMPYLFSSTALAFSLGLHTYICTEMGFELSLSLEGIVSISLSSKYANVTCGLCGNFNSDPADDLAVNGTQEPLIPEHFEKAWRNGQTPWCVEGCLGGSCPKCSSELLVRFSDPESCGKILEVNGPFRQCHGKVDPSSYYKRCVSDLCLHGGLQPALCHSLAEYAAVCLSHNAAVSAWRSPGFCYPSCPIRTSYNISSASVHLYLGCQNKTVEKPLNMAENCLCEAGLVNGVYENLPFSQSNITVNQRNGGITIKTPQSIELTSDLQNYILVKMPDIYYQTTCGLCGKYNDDPADDLQLPNGTVTSDHDIHGLSWKLCNADVPCSEEWESSSDLNCGFIPNPRGPFSSCHQIMQHVMRQGGRVELWLNTTSCATTATVPIYAPHSVLRSAWQCCAPETEEGCQCDTGHLYDGRACVPAEQCGCLQDGKQNPASCEGKCDATEKCYLSNGVPVCESRRGLCWAWGGRHNQTFDGLIYDFEDDCGVRSAYVDRLLVRCTVAQPSAPEEWSASNYSTRGCVNLMTPRTVDGQYKALPYSHLTGHVYAYRTPLSIIIHTDVGLQLIVYNTGTLRVSLPSSYGSSVSGLCGNANTDSHDDLMMPNEELAQNRLDFAHSWISPGSVACKSSCSSRLKHCPAEAQKLFEGSDFCGMLLNELGPFADCALVLSPKLYFHNCVTDSCSFDGHYLALCKSIASYAEACQVAQLPVRQWRSDTFCGMSCPKNSHYELCGPRCPVVCFGLSSPANCSGGCEEGCQCDPGFVLSDGQCVPVNGEERRVPFDIGELKAYQDGNRLIIITPSGVGIDLSSTQYLRLTVPQVNDATASGLCGNFNGDKYDDLELRNGSLSELRRAPAQLGSSRAALHRHRWQRLSSVLTAAAQRSVLTPAPTRALLCSSLVLQQRAVQKAVNATMEMSLMGKSVCLTASVDVFIMMEEQVYNEDCTQRCWCHPLGGVICEETGCSLGQQCALRNRFWGCHDRPEGCELTGSLQVSTLGGQQLSLDPLSSYSLMSLCDKASVHWFSLISYHGPCNGSSRLVTVFQILLHGTLFTIQEGTVKVNGRFMSLPHILPSGVSLSSGVNQDKSEVLVILRRDAGMESELEIEPSLSGHGFDLTFLAGPSNAGGAGREFALSFLLNYAPNYDSPHYQLYITAVQANAKVTVKVPSLNFKQEKTLNAGERVTISLPTGLEVSGSKRSPNTVRIEASADVSVTSFNSKRYTADTSVVYPTTEWGTEYFIFTPASSSYGSYKEFSVTNGKESNKLEIFPLGTIRFEGRVYGSGSQMVIDLQPYESVQLQSVQELSGTRVASQHPVAVVTGHTCTWRFARCNHVYEQLLPVSRWGSSFIVPPLTFQSKFDSVFLQASQPTQATVHHGNNKKVFTLVRGQTVEIHSSNPETLSIQADHGIQVLMLFNGVTRSWLHYYDPFLMAILSNDHFCSSYSLEALEGFENKALIVSRTSVMSELRIDGKNLPRNVEWKKVTGTDFSWAEMSYQQIPGNNKHTVSSSGSRFALYSIGVSQMNGYGAQGQCIQPGSGSFSCSSMTCSANEVCEVKGGFPSCVPKAVERKPGTCWASGDPHYRTFDGRHFDFMGTCTYVIAKNCGKDDHLPDFEVLAQNENRGSLRVSYVGVVTVKVYGVIITVVRSETGRVRIDNSLWSLPITLNKDKLTMIQSGRSLVIETDFGLTVRYDWEHNLGVTLSSSYAGKTCGLCGNFNDNPNDDFTTPSGTQAGGAVAFGSSWKVPVKGAVCRDDCVGGCERCENSLMKMWGGDMFCGLIPLIINGPFSKCHAVIDPQAYLENCKYDVCMGGGLRQFLCRTLEAYTEACQIAGIQVQDWRKMARCTAKCPANSHYELCGNACPATCSDPNTSSKCKRPCVEICTCNTGFLLSGGQCVPAARCGCSYEGRNIPAGESFWADQGCLRRCKCVAGSRRVECQDKGCRAGQQCQVVGGIRECQAVSHSTCQATGDPHYVTFDNKKFNFQGTCVYQLAALCSKDPELVPFEVLVQNDHRGNRVVSYTKLVEIKVHSLSIVITKTHKGLIMVNKELVNLPVTLDDGRVSVFKSGWSAVVKTNFGLKVSFNWYGAVFVTLPSNYMGAVCGLCGNYNGKPQDDLTPKNGDKPVLPADFGVSWRVAEIPGCVDGCKGVCPSCDITQKVQYEKGDFCGLLRDPKGPFRDCHAKVDPAAYFEDCVYDVCLYEGRKDVLCQAITSYTSACQAVGAKMYRWRSIHYCAVKCPVHSHYEVCAPGCPASCQSLIHLQGCEAQCAEGCSCDEGYILSGDRCVPFSQCGCVYNDRYYRIGQVFYPNGQCQEECKCTQDDEVVCKKFTCGPNEKCKVEDGVQKCHPVGKGVCHASGDPHYRSFDGRTFDFQGTCTYTLSKSCGLEGTHLEAFSVQVENERWNKIMNKMVAVTKLVAVDVYGFTLIMRNNMFGVLVNGVFNYLPVNLNDGAVLVYQEGLRYVIATDFGLIVTYDLVYHVTVTVPGNYRGKVCGLCGNFNGEQKDDFQMPNHKPSKNVNVFGKSWKVTIPNVVCENGCKGKNCPVCDPARKAVFSKSTYCGIVTAPNGPFAACHSKLDPQPHFADCVFDVCASNGDGKVLCNSIAAYAFNCHMAGVDVNNWRTPSFCPMKCPANSHYEVCADACSASCAGLTEIAQCSSSCTEGCECDAGFLFNGHVCVQETECGCYDNGRSYKPGEVVYEEDCNTKCTCNPETGIVCEKHSCPQSTKCMVKKGIRACYNTDPCKDACRVKEKCRVEKGEAVCVPEYTGTCWAWGDPHYHTFDGFNFNFQGTCKYVISKTCGNLDGLVPFSVTERNDNRGNTAVSFVREVDVSVYGYNITLHKNRVGRVTVDGEQLNLPVQLGEGQGEVSVSQRGHTAVVETDFGLSVSYDWNWKLVIKLPSSYYTSVCGLCGNFNGNNGDELQNPAGKAVSSVKDWGKSWQTPEKDEKHPCWDTCEKDCPTCDSNQKKLYESGAFCGGLKAKTNNVFKPCHGKLDPQAFMNNCVYDMCLNKGDKKMLCQALASYSQQCRGEGIIIKDWRKKFACPMSCQRHSHYEICTSPCQPSCPFPDQKSPCPGACVEACVCDKGHVLSAGVCVPAKSCGCSYQGRYYKPGQHFWADEACGRLCECDTTLGMVTCHEASCSAQEMCTVVDGERTCQPISHATCTASGDPHYRTFDGRRFDFQGTCVYQLVGLCSQQQGLVPFKVTVQNDHRGSKAVSYTRTVTFSIYGITLTISREYPHKVLVSTDLELNGQLASLPLDYNDELVVFLSGGTAVVETDAGITVTFDWRGRVSVSLPSNYQGAVCGLCGNYNGKAQDDLTMRNGQTSKNGAELGESWQVALVPGCSSVCQGAWCQACSDSHRKKYQAQKYCGIIADLAGPFRDCHSRVDPAPYLEDCVYDACQYHGYQGSVCDAVGVYVSACQSQGITIRSWRTDAFCPMVCPANSHYTLYATGCPVTCASLTSLTTCHRAFSEACECDEGYLQSGDTCVPVRDCGCSYDGQYYRKGDVFYPETDCVEQCVCGENGAVSCQKAKCRAGETCKLVNGMKGCHPDGQGKCVASGDPHYISFDGKRFDFQGTCVYMLAKVCDDDKGRLTPFSVTQGNEKYGNGKVAVTKSIAVAVYGYVIYIQQKVPWKVTVDDEILNLPLYLDNGRLRVTQEGRNIIIRTDFGLTVLYDTVYYVEVIMPSTYQGKMCGLCGNYNKNNRDDFRLPGGRKTNSVDDFGKSWVVDMPGNVCGGCGGQCPVCEQAKATLYGKSDSCGFMSAPNGPFKACHSKIDPAAYVSNCVFDVCAVDGNKDNLCNSVQAYALACQSEGVQIQPWRSSSFCPASCPANSHYEVGQADVDKACTSKCVCQASGVVNCEKLTCASGEVCDVRDGVRGCHVKQGHCSVNQVGLLTSFDGMSGAIGAQGAFEVASLCDETDKMWFRVVVDVRVCSKGASPTVATLYVFFKETVVTVNSQHVTWVNGRKMSLPSKVTSDISVHISERTVIIEKPSAVRLTYSLSKEVTVIIDSSLSGKMCGACGNYNNNSKDDMRTADGKITSDVSVVVGSWSAGDFSR